MDDKLPKCGCGGNGVVVRHGKRAPHYWSIVCGHCVISTHTHETTEAAIAVWTRAMSAPAPGMEAMRALAVKFELLSAQHAADALANLKLRNGDGALMANSRATSFQIAAHELRAALQAAERGKA